MALGIAMVTVDCTDPTALAGFWSAALNTSVAADYGGYIMLAPAAEGGPVLAFQQVPEPRNGKNRLHLDLTAVPGTRQAEAERLVGLGATNLGERGGEEAGFTWFTMTDPEGNEFCIAEVHPS